MSLSARRRLASLSKAGWIGERCRPHLPLQRVEHAGVAVAEIDGGRPDAPSIQRRPSVLKISSPSARATVGDKVRSPSAGRRPGSAPPLWVPMGGGLSIGVRSDCAMRSPRRRPAVVLRQEPWIMAHSSYSATAVGCAMPNPEGRRLLVTVNSIELVDPTEARLRLADT